MGLKIMILTDSDGNPRTFPPVEVFKLEETWPYLLRERFKDATFWQLSYGNITTMKLVNQPMGYLTHWDPDVIIVQSGIADCRPEAFSDLQKEIIGKMTWKFFKFVRPYVEHPEWIRRRQVYRVSPSSYRTTLKKFKLSFPKSKIFWLEISVGPKYDNTRPGVSRRLTEFNAIIRQVYGEDFVPTLERIMQAEGFNVADHGHPNKRGHQAIADIIIPKVEEYLVKAQPAYGQK